MIFVDDMMSCVPNPRWRFDEACHLFCDPGELDALHSFAAAIGLKRAWFQSRIDLPHYDLTRGKRELALRRGAMPLGRRETVAVMHKWRALKNPQSAIRDPQLL